jgi:tetratricopeptide (TPR) repeat protein
VLLRETGKPADALSELEQAIAIYEQLVRENPTVTEFQSNLGAALNNLAQLHLNARRFAEARDRLLKAIEYQKRALTANSQHAIYRQFLKNHYLNLLIAAAGLNDSSLATQARQGLAELAASDPSFATLDARLNAVVSGEAAKNTDELLALAQRAYEIQRFALAARFFNMAIQDESALANNRETQHAYNAACCAALAGSGQTLDDPPPEESAKSKLRGQALNWLQAELKRWTEFLETDSPEQREVVSRTLEHWQTDVDLAGVRDESELAKIPDAERADWQELWKRVEELIAQTAVVSTEQARPDP